MATLRQWCLAGLAALSAVTGGLGCSVSMHRGRSDFGRSIREGTRAYRNGNDPAAAASFREAYEAAERAGNTGWMCAAAAMEGESCLRSGEPRKALQAVSAVNERGIGTFDTHFVAGRAFIDVHEYDPARKQFEQAIHYRAPAGRLDAARSYAQFVGAILDYGAGDVPAAREKISQIHDPALRDVAVRHFGDTK